MTSIRHSLGAGVAIAIAGAVAPASAADLLSSAIAFGGPTQNKVTCYFTNAGIAPLTISNFRIFGAGGAAVALSANTCGASAGANLALRATCAIEASVNNSERGCSVETANKTNLRGTIEFRDANAVVLNSVPLQ